MWWSALTPSRLTPLVNEYSSRYLDAQVRFDTVTLSVFENFPNVSVKLSGGEIISHAFAGLPDSLRTRIPAAADTLLKFDEFSVSLNLPQLLASRISIRRIALTRPRVYAYVSPWGKANWEIFAADTTAGDSTEQGGDLYLNIAGLDIRNSGRIVYDSMDDGRMVGLGRHADLLKTCPVYEEIYASQFKKGDAQK